MERPFFAGADHPSGGRLQQLAQPEARVGSAADKRLCATKSSPKPGSSGTKDWINRIHVFEVSAAHHRTKLMRPVTFSSQAMNGNAHDAGKDAPRPSCFEAVKRRFTAHLRTLKDLEDPHQRFLKQNT
jgi:hypothetical protein